MVGVEVEVEVVMMLGVAVAVVAMALVLVVAGDSSGLGGSGWLAASAIRPVALAALAALPGLLELPGDADCAGLEVGVTGRLEAGLVLWPWFPRRSISSTKDFEQQSSVSNAIAPLSNA